MQSLDKWNDGPGNLRQASLRVVRQELINIIAGNLRDPPRVLRRCSLVCSSWLQTSQRHLFRRIVLGPPNARYRRLGNISYSQRLYWLLLESPQIATYIQQL